MKWIRWGIYSLYLTMATSGVLYLVAGLGGTAPWIGMAMLLASCAAGYAVSGFVKRRVALAAVVVALAVAAAELFLMPYGNWNVLLALLNIVCVILGARHNWKEPDTWLIDIRLIAAGLLCSAIAYVVAFLNGCEAPQPQIGYTTYVFICVTVLLVNRKSIQLNAGGQAVRMMRSNQIMAWVFVGVFTLAVFMGPLQRAVGALLRGAIAAFFELFNKEETPGTFQPTVVGDDGEMDLSALDGNVQGWPPWLQVLSDIVLYSVTIVVLLALAAGLLYALIRACKELSKYLKNWFATFGSAGNDEYSEESEQMMTAQSMRKQFQDDLTRRVKKLFERPVRWGALSPNERVRHVYKHMLESETRVTAAAQNLTPQELCRRTDKEEAFAELYGKVRYAEDTITADEVEKYRVYLKN